MVNTVFMGLSWSTLALGSTTVAVTLLRYAPEYTLHRSFFQTFMVLMGISAIIRFIHIVFIYPYLLSPLRHLPQPKGASFINGQWHRIRSEPTGQPQMEWVQDVPNDGLIYYRGFMNAPRLIPTSPQALAEVLTQKSYEFTKPSFLRKNLGRILGVGLVLSEGDEHRTQRKNLMPAFAFRHVKDLYPTFWDKSCKLVRNLMAEIQSQGGDSATSLSDAAAVEISGWGSRAALDIIGVAGLGQDFEALDNPDNELNAVYRKIFQPSRTALILGTLQFVLPGALLRALPISHNNNIAAASEYVKGVCRQLIQQKVKKLQSEKERTDVDILSVAIESGGFSEEELVNQLMTFLVAGHETTATSLTWAVNEMCKHPEMQTRLREEIRSKIPSADSDATIDSHMIERCHYLNAFCNEVLRTHAPVPATLREADGDSTLQGQQIPKGTVIIVPIWGINSSTAYWGEDAGVFDPERWMGAGKAGNGGATNNFASLTFLHGPRSCIGQQFARAEFAALVAALAGRFEFAMEDPDWVPIIRGGITARPKDGMRVKIRAIPGW